VEQYYPTKHKFEPKENAMAANLSSHLLDAYVSSRGQRPLKTAQGLSLKIDDQNEGDTHQVFRQINAVFPGPNADTFVLELHNAPYDDAVRELIEAHGGQIKVEATGSAITLPLNAKNAPLIRKFAKAVRRIIGRGRRYPVPNWKWICPRTATSLEQLADHLAAFRQGQSR
jgi:hypothetical protein